MRMTVVSGLSGSGKSIALQTLEDLDYYCVDNLPIELLPAFVEKMLERTELRPQQIVVGIDARSPREDLADFPKAIDALKSRGLAIVILFLQATDEALLKRYSETRRRHPLSREDLPLLEAIRHERRLLEPLAALADLTIDTSHTNIHELRGLVRARLHEAPHDILSLLFISFGYKHGVPTDADIVFDVRCLPNPHWVPNLRASTGLDDNVIAFLQSHAEVQEMLSDICRFLETWIPRFETDNRSYLTVAIGCTGGQHRSVYLAQALSQHFSKTRRKITTRHRELK